MNQPADPPHEPRRDPPRAEQPDEPSAPGDSWRIRLRRGLGARRNALLDAGIAFLERHKSGPMIDREARLEQRQGKQTAEEPIPPAATHPGRRRWLLLAALFVGGSLAAMMFSYRLLSGLLDQRLERIRAQLEQITALNEEDKNKSARIADLLKKFDDEQGKRVAAEERNIALEVTVMELESQAREPLSPEPVLQRATDPRKRLQPSRASTFSPAGRARSPDCNLKGGNYGENLKRCIDEFNRK